MPEEPKQSEKQASSQKPEEAAAPAGKSGLIKYLLFGAGAVVVGLVVTVVAMKFMAGEPAAEVEDSHEQIAREIAGKTGDKTAVDKAADAHAETPGYAGVTGDEMELADFDDSAIDKILENLEFLDYEPSEDELVEDEGGMTKEDSIAQVNWLEKEKTALAQREKELNTRQRDLDRLEKEVNKKLLNLEQVESARTAQLAKLYDGMDPRAVANLLANLDDGTVVSILPRMKLKNASAVLQLMPAQRAAKLSKQMITIAGK
jgi:flagellar motility protein MotE (MotC chaperone)